MYNDNIDNLFIDCPAPQDAIHNVYVMVSTGETVRYLHSALGFPNKSTMLEVIQNKWLFSYPSIIASVVNEFFTDSEETRKGHMKQQRQGVRSKKPKIHRLINYKITIWR